MDQALLFWPRLGPGIGDEVDDDKGGKQDLG